MILTIEKLAALAALLPIASLLASNAGNQTAVVLVNYLGCGYINESSTSRILLKEFAISLLNGIVWGGIAGVFSYLLNQDIHWGIFMASVMLLNFLLATLVGVLIPVTLHKVERIPIAATNLLILLFTTSVSYLVLLGVATIFLAD